MGLSLSPSLTISLLVWSQRYRPPVKGFSLEAFRQTLAALGWETGGYYAGGKPTQ